MFVYGWSSTYFLKHFCVNPLFIKIVFVLAIYARTAMKGDAKIKIQKQRNTFSGKLRAPLIKHGPFFGSGAVFRAGGFGKRKQSLECSACVRYEMRCSQATLMDDSRKFCTAVQKLA